MLLADVIAYDVGIDAEVLGEPVTAALSCGRHGACIVAVAIILLLFISSTLCWCWASVLGARRA